LKFICEYYDKELKCIVQSEFESETIGKAKNEIKKILVGKKYSEPALYIKEEST
jgi:hypothetical protein